MTFQILERPDDLRKKQQRFDFGKAGQKTRDLCYVAKVGLQKQLTSFRADKQTKLKTFFQEKNLTAPHRNERLYCKTDAGDFPRQRFRESRIDYPWKTTQASIQVQNGATSRAIWEKANKTQLFDALTE